MVLFPSPLLIIHGFIMAPFIPTRIQGGGGEEQVPGEPERAQT